MYFLQTTPFLSPQAQKQAPAATVTESKEVPAADQLVYTPTQLAQDPVRQLDLSATDRESFIVISTLCFRLSCCLLLV